MPQKILIADDDVETLRLIGLMLQRQGFVPEGMIRGAQNAGMSPTTAGMLGAAGAGAIVLAAYGLSKYKLTKMREEGEIP